MELTTELLERYIGGDFEVQNSTEGNLFRGPIKAAKVEDGDIILELDWFAKNDGGPNRPAPTWTADETRTYKASLFIYSVSDIGAERICIQSFITNELGVLFPPGGSKLDPTKVAGLAVV
ncbi:hypothetical protein KW794_02565 [Candidatus Saccharibacteria bacterium]|nr:hypothetical protein [Candidatus Saccharibacteria bacterium]